jgi:hypothetical protein
MKNDFIIKRIFYGLVNGELLGGYFFGINTISNKLQPKLNRNSEEAGFDREVLASDAE